MLWRVALIIAAGSLSLIAQTPARDARAPRTATGTIQGRIVRADTGEPLRRVRVTITAGGYGPSTFAQTFTDDSGRFSFASVPTGRYGLAAAKAGFVLPRRTATQIDLGDGAVESIEWRLPRSAAISGRLLNEFGDPIERAGVTAHALRRTDRGTVSSVAFRTTTTDDLGEYRLDGLPAGSYVVSATAPPNASTAITADGRIPIGREAPDAPPTETYYPGVHTVAGAQALSVRAGEERTSIDFTAIAGTPARLTISAVDEKGTAAPILSLTLVSPDSLTGAARNHRLEGFPTTAAFTVEPGDWAVQARGRSGEVGAARVSVGSSDTSITVQLKKGARLAGRVTSDGPPLPRDARVTLQAVWLDPSLGRIAGAESVTQSLPDGTFALGGLLGPRDLRVQSLPRGWAVKAMTYAGRNLLGTPIDFSGSEELANVEIVVTNRLAHLTGTVVDADNARVFQYRVFLFPNAPGLDRSYALRRSGEPNTRGAFRVDDLLPGAYLAIAVADVDDFESGSPDYLGRLRSLATPLTIDGLEHTVILRLASLP